VPVICGTTRVPGAGYQHALHGAIQSPANGRCAPEPHARYCTKTSELCTTERHAVNLSIAGGDLALVSGDCQCAETSWLQVRLPTADSLALSVHGDRRTDPGTIGRVRE